MNKILAFFLIILCFSCHKRQMGGFQPSHPENYSHRTRILSPEVNEKLDQKKGAIKNFMNENLGIGSSNEEDSDEDYEKTNKKTNRNSDYQNSKNRYTKSNSDSKNYEKRNQNTRKYDQKNSSDHKKPAKKKPKRKHRLFGHNPLINDSIKIGTVFLVIGVVLALLGITQLMWMFGLAALIFLYLGIKKYLIKKRLRNLIHRR